MFSPVVVNVGNAMQRWTNDKLRSTPHRVGNSIGDAMRRSRYSAAPFYNPNLDVILSCLSTSQNPEYPSRYAPIRAGDYL
ncbi:MAG: hypothetical protein MJA27_14235 [Pseudanabaenales cyanobacterium]|nr:hypothetical protein [Pseudanabaenales cyanobacterium]